MPQPISVTILAKNSQELLPQCLQALAQFPEVILLDNGSTDATVSIAGQFPNVKVFHSPFIGFGPLKNLAASYASHDWILSIDSDEVMTPELVQTILTYPLDNARAYRFLRHNFYGKRLINACGWENDYVLRLFNRRTTRFTDREVHEGLITQGLTLETLPGILNHYSFKNTSELLQKLNQYTTLFAQENRFKKKSSAFKATYKAIWTFTRNYFLKRGFLYGFEGFLISACNANGAFYKYMKLHEANRSMTTSLIISTYNWPEALEVVLKSVALQHELPDEVIIADDGSRAETKAVIERFQQNFPVPLRHCWHEDTGFRLAAIRNKAMAMATSEYLLSIDGDMVLHPDFVKSHKRMARGNTFIQGKRVLLQPELTRQILHTKKWHITPFTSGIINRFNAISSKTLAKLGSRKRPDIKAIRGCNMAFWRADVVKINGFNENIQGWGREDSEFAIRMLNAGVERRNLPFGGVGYHLYHPENARTSLPENDKILADAIEMKSKWCENGIGKYLKV
ncbi:glycosyltransferase [Rufibacter sediminis]|uniref:Glycosyltransferase n=1 Tax=Rufibacter sediminis TaxID=2762756 RepID=A0ABR6VYB1_9BACT|nr:glycosyltransferase [Rufibacter sediminis]MBC3541897.1 glycosyltransferase [Rufibacter sediminis]